MGRLSGRGITVILYDKVQTGTDGFGRPIYEDRQIPVGNVLIGEPTSQEITDILELTGKRLAYTLAIPEGDTHRWTDRKVGFFGEVFQTIGAPTQGIEELIPLEWNKKVKVERIG